MDNTRMIEAENVWPGDYVDLEGDTYSGDNTAYCYEYGIVEQVEFETPNCIVIHFENFDSIGFPVDHQVKVLKI